MDYLKSRWQELDRGRRIILALQPILFALSLLVGLTYGRQPVVEYMDAVLRAEVRGEAAVYSGRVDGHAVRYLVSPGPVVEFWLDGALDSTYTVTEDPTAIPDTERVEHFGRESFTGVEIRRDGEPWFRGARLDDWPHMLVSEDGADLSWGIAAVVMGEDLAPEPDAGDILFFANDPETTPRGYGPLILVGLFFSALCTVSLLFEDQLFRWNLSFQIRDPYGAEPSDWELLGRWAGWVVFTGAAAVFYALGAGVIHISS